VSVFLGDSATKFSFQNIFVQKKRFFYFLHKKVSGLNVLFLAVLLGIITHLNSEFAFFCLFYMLLVFGEKVSFSVLPKKGLFAVL